MDVDYIERTRGQRRGPIQSEGCVQQKMADGKIFLRRCEGCWNEDGGFSDAARGKADDESRV